METTKIRLAVDVVVCSGREWQVPSKRDGRKKGRAAFEAEEPGPGRWGATNYYHQATCSANEGVTANSKKPGEDQQLAQTKAAMGLPCSEAVDECHQRERFGCCAGSHTSRRARHAVPPPS